MFLTNESNNGGCDQWPNLLKWKISIGETICEMCGLSGDGSMNYIMNYEDYRHLHKQFKARPGADRVKPKEWY